MDAPRVSAPDLACKQAASYECVNFLGNECLLLGSAWIVREGCHAISAQDGLDNVHLIVLLEAVINKGLAIMMIPQNQYMNSNYIFIATSTAILNCL